MTPGPPDSRPEEGGRDTTPQSQAPDEVRRRKGLAATVALGLPLACLGFWLALFGAPAPGPPVRSQAAAISIRDHVSTFEKWGTHWYTVPYLTRSYAEVTHITAHAGAPRRAEFQAAVAEALAKHEHVDLFLLAHSNHYYGEVRALPEEQRARLRLVYNTGCSDAWQAGVWRDLGADAYVGHPGASASPVFYFYFLRRWTAGASAGDATDHANERMHRTLGVAEHLNPFDLDLNDVGLDTHATLSGGRDVRLP